MCSFGKCYEKTKGIFNYFFAFIMIVIINYKLEELKGYSVLLFVILVLGGGLIRANKGEDEGSNDGTRGIE